MRVPSREYDGGRACGFSGVDEIYKWRHFECLDRETGVITCWIPSIRLVRS